MSDSKAWYKQFWPWFIIGLLSSVVIASLVTVRIAFKNPDGLVSDDYYKEGLAINQRLEQDQVASKQQLSATLKVEGAELVVEMAGNSLEDVSALQLQFTHPLNAEKDMRVVLPRQTGLRYATRLEAPVTERFYITLSDTQQRWRLRKEIPSLQQGSVQSLEAER